MKTKEPKQTMKEFFARADVKALQDIQKRNPFKSEAHKHATAEIKKLAQAIGAEAYV